MSADISLHFICWMNELMIIWVCLVETKVIIITTLSRFLHLMMITVIIHYLKVIFLMFICIEILIVLRMAMFLRLIKNINLNQWTGKINTSLNSSFKISFINDDNACIHNWVKRLLSECMMLGWLEPELVFDILIFDCFRFIWNSLKEY
jgi:hypothetical protein